MTNIYIKSFNRAYYLDRCLQSIEKYVSGEYKVVVLDDGTPEKYLQKIREKYPDVEIRVSEQYDYKINSIRENLTSGKQIDGFKIPIPLWKEAVRTGSEYMIMTEDDVWFTSSVNLDKLSVYMKEFDMVLIKLGWISKRRLTSEFIPLNEELTAVEPKIFTAPRWFMKDFFFRNKWKVFSLMYKLGLVDNHTKLEYWAMNAMLMGMFRKDYWLAVWETLDNRVDEREQLINATDWYRKNKRKNLFGKMNFEMMKTTFISSATNSYHRYGDEFDVNQFNHIMNEEWYNGNLDTMNNFPKDFSEQIIISILQEKNLPKSQPQAWKNWAEKFKEQYRSQEVEVD